MKLELFFEIAVPPAESLGFVVAVHDDRSECGSSMLISSSLLGPMFRFMISESASVFQNVISKRLAPAERAPDNYEAVLRNRLVDEIQCDK
jgi:hypothetical protein